MPLTHLNTVGYQSSPVVRSTINTVSLSLSLHFSLISSYPCPSPISTVPPTISRHRRWDQWLTQSLPLSPFFLPLSIPMPLTHLSNTANYQSSPAMRSTTDMVSLLFFPSFSLSLLSSHLHRAILLRRLHQPPSTKPYFHHLTTATPIAIILGAHHRQPLIATHISVTTPLFHSPPMVIIPMFAWLPPLLIAPLPFTSFHHRTSAHYHQLYICLWRNNTKKKLIKWELWISYSLNLFFSKISQCSCIGEFYSDIFSIIFHFIFSLFTLFDYRKTKEDNYKKIIINKKSENILF